MTDGTLVLRTQEIISKSDGPITDREALKRALLERYSTLDEMASAAASFATSVLSKLKKSTYEIPEQAGLFDIPATISNNTAEGVLFIHRDEATIGQVRQWIREGRQHHSTQHLRFKRAAEDLALLKDLPDEIGWNDARRQLDEAQNSEAVTV